MVGGAHRIRLFDNDVTMPDVALAWEGRPRTRRVFRCWGYFTLPVGMRHYSGNLSAAQVAYQPELGGVRWVFALGGYWFDADPDDTDIGGLLDRNGSRDYSTLAASVQARWSVGDRPLMLGADMMHNTKDYDATDPDPVTAANSDQTDGYVLLATYGGLAQGSRGSREGGGHFFTL